MGAWLAVQLEPLGVYDGVHTVGFGHVIGSPTQLPEPSHSSFEVPSLSSLQLVPPGAKLGMQFWPSGS